MVCRGRLVDREGRRLAGFRQTTRLWRGSRVVELEIELDIDRQPGPTRGTRTTRPLRLEGRRSRASIAA